ncbi:hypothetical protein ACYOEI_01450 [Singulisphaera rosea]
MNHTEISAPLPSPAEISSWSNTQSKAQATRAANARSTSGRRRLVDPTTCDREYTSNELEFMQAIQEYKKKSGRMFPTWSEVLEVLQSLGYRKADASKIAAAAGIETK